MSKLSICANDFWCFKINFFHLDNELYKYLIAGVLAETYLLVKKVVEHFFPKKDCDNEDKEKKKGIIDRIKDSF